MEGLNKLARKPTLRLTHYGRKTGKPYEVTIWFVMDGEHIIIGTANRNRQWVRNVQKTPKVKLKIGDELLEGYARFLSDPTEHENAMAKIEKKYWIFWPVFALARVLDATGLMKDKTGSFEVTLNP